jgi:hypothetical protein
MSYIDKSPDMGLSTYQIIAANAAGFSAPTDSPPVEPIGGPDVTLHLLALASSLRKWYRGLPPANQEAFQSEWATSSPEVLLLYFTGGGKLAGQSVAWDIRLLMAQSVKTANNSGILPNGVHSVTVAGKVYPDDEVNYWLFGVIANTLGWNQSSIENIIYWYRVMRWQGTGIAGRIAWFDAGYNLNLQIPSFPFNDGSTVFINNVLPSNQDSGPLDAFAGWTAPVWRDTK